MVSVILFASIVLQFFAVYLAIRVIWLTGRNVGWSLIAAAILLMALRRSVTMVEMFVSEGARQPDLVVECVALAISILMALGVERLTATFKQLRATTLRLGESEARFRDLFENTPDAIVIADMDTGVITDVNSKACELTGKPRSELIGMHQSRLHPAAAEECSRESFRRHADEARAGHVCGPFEHVVRRTDGSETSVEIMTQVVSVDGKPRMLGVFRDITSRKEAERKLQALNLELEERVRARTRELEISNEQLRQARDAAEHANKAKSFFLANMSHEIRTPLHAIAGMAHLLRRSGVTPEQAERLDRIDAASRHLMSIINDILDLSKIEAGKLRLEEAELSVGAVIDNVRSMIAERAETKGLNVVVENAGGPPRLIGDATHLRQALLNYATNAVKFTDRGEVRLRAMVVEEDAQEVVMRFEVQDTGIGIAADVIPRLFSPFEQADTSTTRQYGGTGLGLVITRRIAELMGGTAGVASTPGAGSTFWFTARLKKSQAPARPDDPPPAESAETVLKRDYAGLRILVADDDPDNREITQHLLKAVWDHVDVARDGEEAVRLAGSNAYDLILMDMRMPRMDGLEATRRIRALPGGTDVLILALTANVFPENRDQCTEAGMDDLIPKAMGTDAPLKTILKWLALQRPVTK